MHYEQAIELFSDKVSPVLGRALTDEEVKAWVDLLEDTTFECFRRAYSAWSATEGWKGLGDFQASLAAARRNILAELPPDHPPAGETVTEFLARMKQRAQTAGAAPTPIGSVSTAPAAIEGTVIG